MKKLLILPFLILPIITASCRETVNDSDFLMDTVITYNITADDAHTLIGEASEQIAELEAKLSAHEKTSEVARFNAGEITAITDPDIRMILEAAMDVNFSSGGAYDVTVAPLVALWGINRADDSFTPPDKAGIDAERSRVGSEKLFISYDDITKLDQNVSIDLGGIAKGYALGAVAEKLTAQGAQGTVNFGGSIAVIGSKPDGTPYRIGIKNPTAPDSIIGTVEMESGMTAVSGNYERFAEYDGKRYHHIIDPKTGYPAESDLASAAVIVSSADRLSGALCDALSTALFIMGSEASLELYRTGAYDFEAVLIKHDGTVILTDGLLDRYTSYEEY